MQNLSLTVILLVVVPGSCELVALPRPPLDGLTGATEAAPLGATCVPPSPLPAHTSVGHHQEAPEGLPVWMHLDKGWEENLGLGQEFIAQLAGYSNFVDFLISEHIIANELSKTIEMQVQSWIGMPF